VAGLWCGLAVWSSLMSLELLIPAAPWFVPATHDWTNLHLPGYRADLLTGFPGRLGQIFPIVAAAFPAVAAVLTG
jgi:hypothetical protein